MFKNIFLVCFCAILIFVASAEENEKEDTSKGRNSDTTADAQGNEEKLTDEVDAGTNVEILKTKGSEDESEILETSGTEDVPVPEKFIGHRRKTPQDRIRDEMIGMIFTGEPTPLGYRPRPKNRQQIRRNFRPRNRPRPGFPSENEPQIMTRDEPDEILKPMPFIPRPSQVEFLIPSDTSASSHSEFILRPKQTHRGPIFRPHNDRGPNPRQSPTHRTEDIGGDFLKIPRHPDRVDEHFSSSKHIFSNTVGPDFGPVTFEDFGSNSQSDFNNFELPRQPDEHKRPQSKPKPRPRPPPRKPSFKPPKDTAGRPFGFSNTKFGGFDQPKFQNRFPKFGSNERGPDGCHKYTEDICLDTDNYPHQEILSSLAQDPARARTLMAEVRDQSADDLVDGVTAAQESRYDYTHYFGNNRRQGTRNDVHRDFASEGGYLCPSEVKYARPKRARNSKGEWKFIVNLEKYSQTIRMEKCMKPGGSCSYVSHHYRAMCNQIYNYQRLLSWEKKRGLHMDIFKVPSCCTCHIQGYAYVFPPLGGKRGRHQVAGSERIDKVVPFIDDGRSILDFNKEAPPYSPVNFPNLPEIREIDPSRMSDEDGLIPRRRKIPRRRIRIPAGTSVKRSDNPEHRVNYGYHPIIDFFEEPKKQ